MAREVNPCGFAELGQELGNAGQLQPGGEHSRFLGALSGRKNRKHPASMPAFTPP